MTIDEAIAKYKEITNIDAICPAHCNISCDKCVQESRQLTDWLEELKSYREHIFSGDMTQAMLKEVYNKAIDDFASKLIMYFADWELSNAPFNDDETDEIGEIICETIENAICGVEEIAEQLKAGANNEQSI